MIGKTLSHFRITAKLGEGGMGAVYRAEDTKLGREVAIKVLPEAVASDPERLARFEREAKVLASLNHPNIAAIHSFESAAPGDPDQQAVPEGRPGDSRGVPAAAGRTAPGDHDQRAVSEGRPGDSRGVPAAAGRTAPRESPDGPPLHFLVLELAHGEDLATRLDRGPLPLDEALPIAQQLTEALEAAHDKDIIHRDLKPANIKVDESGKVKVLDFGLAKALDPQDSGTSGTRDLSMSPTLTAQMTQAGVILGTAAYMAPEQARGKAVDRRADIWAFGCVLFEMLTGKRTFRGETVSDVLARILERPVDFEQLPETTPGALRRLLQRCLEKDPALRLRDIGDARWDLEAARHPDPALEAPTTSSRKGSIGRSALAFALGLAVGGALLWLLASPSDREVAPAASTAGAFVIEVPPSEPYTVMQNAILDLSPDGQLLVYAAEPADSPEMSVLYLRRLDSFQPEVIPDTEGAYAPFFSADGEWIGYFQGSFMWKKALRGGAAFKLAPVSGFSRGGCWTDDDRIFYTPTWFSGIYEIPASGGEPQPVTTLLDGEKSHRYPAVLADGSALLFTVGNSEIASFDDASIAIQNLATGERKTLIEGGALARFLPPNRLLFGRNGQLFVATLDRDKLEIVDTPTPVVEDLITAPAFGSSQFALAGNGTLAYLAGSPEIFDAELVQVSREGEITRFPIAPRLFTSARFAPDGKRLALRSDAANGQIWIYDLERETLSKLPQQWDADFPDWSPDGESLAYVVAKGNSSEILLRRADLTGEPTVLWTGSNLNSPDLAPDGRSLVFSDVGEATDRDIWLLQLDGEAKASPYLQTAAAEGEAVIAPDGRWLAYTSDESGRVEVYVQSYPVPGGRFQISARGGGNPAWSASGTELLFKNEDVLMVVDVELGERFNAGIPRRLVDLADLSAAQDTRSFDISPDGRQIVTVMRAADWQLPTRLHLVLDWAATLD